MTLKKLETFCGLILGFKSSGRITVEVAHMVQRNKAYHELLLMRIMVKL